jgi:hypothetical protein
MLLTQSDKVYFKLGSLQLEPDYSGALYAPDHKALIVADLHFEKASTLSDKTGALFPPFDTQDTLLRLGDTIDRYRPDRVIFLGDTWHDEFGHSRMQDADRQRMQSIITRYESIFISGNHDEIIPTHGGPNMVSEIELDGVALRHEPHDDIDKFQICGHFHPVVRLLQKGRMIRRRCFYISEKQCVLPAMGALSGGLNCLDPVYDRFVSSTGRRAIVLGNNRLFQIGMKSLRLD